MIRALVLTAVVTLGVTVSSAAATGNLVDLRATPTLTGARLRITVKHPGGAGIVRRFATVHERPLHLFVVGDALDFFAHEHPVQQPDGVFMVDLALPRAGLYMAIVSFQPEGGAPQTIQHAFTTGSAFARPARAVLDTAPKIVDGMRVSLDASRVKAGERQVVTVQVEDAASGTPIVDLEPLLGAAAHLLLVSPDLTESVHEHPPASGGGPSIAFRPLVPGAGVFKMWIRFQRAGRVSTAAFVIEVP